MGYNRYNSFVNNGKFKCLPFIKIEEKPTDFFEVYKKNRDRLDLISYKYYKSPDYAWLILQANPEVASMEYEIPNNTILRIPYPLEETLSLYNAQLQRFLELN